MRKIKVTAAILGIALLLSGCGKPDRDKGKYRLPENPVMYTSVYDADSNAMAIEYNGRVYTHFGTSTTAVPDDHVKECIGYLDHREDYRLYTLVEDPECNYLMEVSINSIRGSWRYYRANDTKDMDIQTPSYVESNGFDCWGSSGLHHAIENDTPASIALKVKCRNIKRVNCYVTINGETTFCSEAASESGRLIRKNDFVYMTITKDQLGDTPLDKPFAMDVTFTVTDRDGNDHPVEGSYTHDMMLGSYLFNIDINSDNAGGYYIESFI